jgi:hypothetical protein
MAANRPQINAQVPLEIREEFDRVGATLGPVAGMTLTQSAMMRYLIAAFIEADQKTQMKMIFDGKVAFAKLQYMIAAGELPRAAIDDEEPRSRSKRREVSQGEDVHGDPTRKRKAQ